MNRFSRNKIILERGRMVATQMRKRLLICPAAPFTITMLRTEMSRFIHAVGYTCSRGEKKA